MVGRILACRDDAKGEEAKASIQRDSGFQRVEYWKLDLGSFESVRGFAERFGREGGGRLDILVRANSLS